MHVPSGKGVSGRRDGAGQRFALTGGHLDHVAGEHAQRAEQLHIERPQARRPFGRFPGDGEELRDVVGFGEIVEVEQPGRLAQLLVGEAGGFLVVLRRGGYLASERLRSFSVLAPSRRQNRLLSSARFGAGGLWHRSTVRERADAASARVRPRHAANHGHLRALATQIAFIMPGWTGVDRRRWDR